MFNAVFIIKWAVHFSLRKLLMKHRINYESLQRAAFVLFRCAICLFSPNITQHDIPWLGTCLLFLAVYCNTSRPTHIWFSPLRTQTHSRRTLWRKWGWNEAVADPSRLSKDFYCKCRFFFLLPTLIKKKKKSMSRVIVETVSSLGIIFFTNWMCFPSLDRLNSP